MLNGRALAYLTQLKDHCVTGLISFIDATSFFSFPKLHYKAYFDF